LVKIVWGKSGRPSKPRFFIQLKPYTNFFEEVFDTRTDSEMGKAKKEVFLKVFQLKGDSGEKEITKAEDIEVFKVLCKANYDVRWKTSFWENLAKSENIMMLVQHGISPKTFI
jgi:hypothetical protein